MEEVEGREVMDVDQSLLVWDNLAANMAIVSWVLAGLTVVVYGIKLLSIRDLKLKYDFISRYEIKFLLIIALLCVVGAILYFNHDVVKISPFLLAMRIILSICGGLFIMVIVQSFLRFYYPFFIEKRLKKLRDTPRISPKTGKPMVRLSEAEEDVYLDEGMIAEENVFSVDYDVWKDPDSGYVKIEKYAGHLHALKCPSCGFQTLKLVREEVIQEPTISFDGELMKHYSCNYCNHKFKHSTVLRNQYNAPKDSES